ncbi:MAG: PmoA family protein [Bacteroidales bacterium]|nr:PmoA family protein [Bacteroidales bacterium]
MSVRNVLTNVSKNRSLKKISLVIRIMTVLLMTIPAVLTCSCQTSDVKEVKLVTSDTRERIDIYIDDVLFTSFHYSSDFEKPFLYPVNAPGGYVITRGFPIDPRQGERVDHPHQVGLWFNHGSVNGLDFWNNSSAIPAGRKGGYGHIIVKEIVKAESGEKGILELIANWNDNEGNTLLEERTRYILSATDHTRTIDHITTLTAVNDTVTIFDNKEGLFAIRVDRAFEMPSDEALVFTDERGNPTTVPAVDNTGVTGMYLSSHGLKGDAVWGTRNDWVLLSGTKDNTLITMGIFDHTENPGYPAYFHARGYGLFSINNLGQKSYDPNQEAVSYNLEKGDSLTLRHRFFIKSGTEVMPEEADSVFVEFSKVL